MLANNTMEGGNIEIIHEHDYEEHVRVLNYFLEKINLSTKLI